MEKRLAVGSGGKIVLPKEKKGKTAIPWENTLKEKLFWGKRKYIKNLLLYRSGDRNSS